MQYIRGRLLNDHEAAIIRLSRWGVVFRRFMFRQAPNADYYSQQSFAMGRIDTDTMRLMLEYSEHAQEALEVDEWLQRLRIRDELAYDATFIYYVLRDSGNTRPLSRKEQVARWYQRTKLKKTRYWEKLKRAERYIANMLAVASAFEVETDPSEPRPSAERSAP